MMLVTWACIIFSVISYASAGRFTCYLGVWATYRKGDGSFKIEDVPGNLCTHAIYSFMGIDISTNKIVSLDSWQDIDSKGFERFAGLKTKYPNLKTIMSVGGWGEGGEKYSAMSASPDARQAFIQSVVDLLNQYNFDGLDVDWEYPGVSYRGGQPSDKANFATLMQELRQAFDAQGKGWELSIAVSVVQSVIDVGYDIGAVCNAVHYVNCMTYDFHGTWDSVADVHSPLNRRPQDTGNNALLNTNDGMDNWYNAGCPKEKLIVGIPFYGRSFNIGPGNTNYEEGTPSIGAGDAGPLTNAPGTLAYYEICAYLAQGWTERWDDIGKVPFAYSGQNWVGYENAKSVQAKVDFIRSEGYGGAMTWSIDTDDFMGTCGSMFPLATVAAQAAQPTPAVSAPYRTFQENTEKH